MGYVEQAIRDKLRHLGVDAHLVDQSRHVEVDVYEELAGEVDGVNRVFWLTYLPDPDRLLELQFRGLIRREGGTNAADFVNDGYGRMVLMNTPPKADSDQVDDPPRCRYWRRFDIENVELTSETLPAILRAEEPPYHRPIEETRRVMAPWHEVTA